MKARQDLTTGKEWQVIVKFAIPMMVGSIFQQLYNIADSIIVGKFVGKAALAATGASFPIIFLLYSFVIGLSIGATIIISQFYGAKMIDKVKETSDTFQIIMLFNAVFFTALGILLSRPLFRLMNFPEEHLDLITGYFNVLMIGNVSVFGYNALAYTLRGLGDSKTPVYFLIISNITNIILDLIFVLLFHWGVKGAAWATTIAYTVAFLGLTLHLNRKHKILGVSLHPKFNKSIFKRLLRISLPSSAQMVVVSSGNLLIFGLINMFGTNVIAAYSAAVRINSLATMPSMLFSNAMTAFAGQNFGAGKMDRLKKGLWSTIRSAVLISVSVTVLVQLIPSELMGLFTNDAEVKAIGVNYFKIVSPFYFIFGIMFILNGLYRGIGDTVRPLMYSFVALWLIRFPAAIVLGMKIIWHPFHIVPVDASKIWWNEPMGWFTGMSLALIYYFSKRWLRFADKEKIRLKSHSVAKTEE